MEIRKRFDFENGLLIFYCSLCGTTVHETEDMDYAGTDACEVWEVHLWKEHERECPVLWEDAKRMAEIARSWGHLDARPEDFFDD